MTDRDRQREYLLGWKTVSAELEAIRTREISHLTPADTYAGILALDSAYKMALRDLPPRETSGLVQWQRTMQRWRDRG